MLVNGTPDSRHITDEKVVPSYVGIILVVIVACGNCSEILTISHNSSHYYPPHPVCSHVYVFLCI